MVDVVDSSVVDVGDSVDNGSSDGVDGVDSSVVDVGDSVENGSSEGVDVVDSSVETFVGVVTSSNVGTLVVESAVTACAPHSTGKDSEQFGSFGLKQTASRSADVQYRPKQTEGSCHDLQ